MNALLGPSDDDISQSPEYVQEYLEALEADVMTLTADRNAWRITSGVACAILGVLAAILFGIGAALC